MVKLVAASNAEYGTFYFKTMTDCNKFMDVFKDNLCDIEWNQPIEADSFPEMPQHRYSQINQDPEERAEENLDWGYSVLEFQKFVKLTKTFVGKSPEEIQKSWDQSGFQYRYHYE